MPYFKPYEDNSCKGVYSKSLIGFAGKGSLEWFKDFINCSKNSATAGDMITSHVGIILTPIAIPLLFIYYFITSPFLYKTNSKDFDPDKNLEENLK